MLYEDELIYSVIARAGVRAGITSPKQLLDEVFDNRKVIATTDLPNQISAIVKLYHSHQYTVETLIYSHTEKASATFSILLLLKHLLTGTGTLKRLFRM